MPDTLDRSIAMDAFRQRAMKLSPVPTQGANPQSSQGATPNMPLSGISGGQPRGTETTNILKQVTGPVTRDEVVEALIKRLKGLISKPQGGTTNDRTTTNQ